MVGSTTNSKVFSLREFKSLRSELSDLINYNEVKGITQLKDTDSNSHYLSHTRLALNVIIYIEISKEEKAREKVTD